MIVLCRRNFTNFKVLFNNILLDVFVDVLREQVEAYGSDNAQATISLKAAKMQADPMIACLLLTMVANIIVSSYSDFAAYTGDKCLFIKKFYLHDHTIDKIILLTGLFKVSEEVIASLHCMFPKACQKFNMPRCPLFCNENDPMFCA